MPTVYKPEEPLRYRHHACVLGKEEKTNFPIYFPTEFGLYNLDGRIFCLDYIIFLTFSCKICYTAIKAANTIRKQTTLYDLIDLTVTLP